MKICFVASISLNHDFIFININRLMINEEGYVNI